MSREWGIKIPFRRGDTPQQAAADVHELSRQQDGAIARELLLFAGEQGYPSVEAFGEALDQATRAERLQVVNVARARCGLKALEDTDAVWTARRLHYAAAYDRRRIELAFGPGGGFLEVDQATENREAHQAETRRVEQEQRAHEAAAARRERGIGVPPDIDAANILR